MQVAERGFLIVMVAVLWAEGNTLLNKGIVTSLGHNEDAKFTRRVRQKPDDQIQIFQELTDILRRQYHRSLTLTSSLKSQRRWR